MGVEEGIKVTRTSKSSAVVSEEELFALGNVTVVMATEKGNSRKQKAEGERGKRRRIESSRLRLMDNAICRIIHFQ